MSKDMATPVSGLLGIADAFVAYCVNRAVWTFARTLEAEQEQAVSRLPKNAKPAAETRARQRIIDEFLGIEAVDQPQRFRSPIAGG
jgi:hypothetical protein